MKNSRLKEWGPFSGCWLRYHKNPIIKAENKEKSVQNGPQTIIYYQGKWWLFMMVPEYKQYTKLAVSNDGLNWERIEPDPVLEADQAWEGGIYSLTKSVRLYNDIVYLYYFGKIGIEERIGIATTTDMKHFTKIAQNPVFTVNDIETQVDRIFPDSVVKDDDHYYLFYDRGFDYNHQQHPRSYEICVAESRDRINFQDCPQVNPILTSGEKEKWDSSLVCQASVVKIEDWWYLIYSGSSLEKEGKNGQSFGLARARTPKGPWEKYPENPIFTPALDSEWEHSYVQHACPVFFNGKWRLYYNGNNGKEYAIGVAFLNE